ncbi:hypothetical protein DICPUDRAFT_45162 [Dictyostelium purpureum]|uniref:Coactosin n=1 Tax=Dictyostelium purpureum TaxID=5786 RepID=F0Z975_DICPU|nr:uncharacterized protein DICPUDRAFT_45162 [Dictyostelium purpureum]EGC39504.1 hypothetical protein DICPUDRAFT_45162 [Dictyostelium purpureum]|eukprot:XP_003283951.1 hypothetical protein DICPUDRAFT_45162 [Dictyostelium purpureum]
MADVSSEDLKNAVADVLADSSETNWCLFGYEGNDKIVLRGSGSGGLSELIPQFDDAERFYAYVRVISGDNESKRPKFVFISFVGANVGALKRAKVSVHKASIKKVITNYGVEFHAESQEEVNEEEIMKKVKKASGADYSGNSN